MTTDVKAALLALVLSRSCNRCQHFKRGSGCRLGYDACKSSRPLGVAVLFEEGKSR